MEQRAGVSGNAFRCCPDFVTKLQEILKTDIQIASQLLFCRREVLVTLARSDALLARRILREARGVVRRGGRHREEDKRDADRVAHRVPGRVVRGERVRRDEPTDVAKADLERGADAATDVPAEVHVEPADEDRHRRVHARRGEEERAVLQMQRRGVREQDREANEADRCGDHPEQEPVLCAVGEVRETHREPEGGDPGRDRVQLG
jgi:hypothetical protein